MVQRVSTKYSAVSKSSRFGGGMSEVNDPFDLQSEMKLVPCRWSRTGWKYVEKEACSYKFF